MIWGEEKTTSQWFEPFLARLEIAEDKPLRNWKLAFGSNAIGLGHSAYTLRESVRQQLDPALVKDWMFVFGKGGIRLSMEETEDV